MHSVQTIRLQVEYALLLFSVVHCTIQNLLTFLGKRGNKQWQIQFTNKLIFCGFDSNMEDMEDLLHYLHCWTLFPDIPVIKHKLYKNIANCLQLIQSE